MAHRDDGAPRARAPEPADLARLCRALNEHAARYVLIGGFAMIAHGAGRFTKDIDLLDDAPENVARVRQALPFSKTTRRQTSRTTMFATMSSSELLMKSWLI